MILLITSLAANVVMIFLVWVLDSRVKELEDLVAARDAEIWALLRENNRMLGDDNNDRLKHGGLDDR